MCLAGKWIYDYPIWDFMAVFSLPREQDQWMSPDFGSLQPGVTGRLVDAIQALTLPLLFFVPAKWKLIWGFPSGEILPACSTWII